MIDQEVIMQGNLFVVSGPSASGKSTICKQIIKQDSFIKLAISATTRKPRIGEVDGESYYFLTSEEFAEKIEDHDFYEYAQIYENTYGTLKSPVEKMLSEGYDVILEIEMNGAMQIKNTLPDTVLIFIMPPSLEELRQRLKDRSTETEEQIKLRFESALSEIEQKKDYDHVVVNDDLDRAVGEIINIIHSYRC